MGGKVTSSGGGGTVGVVVAASSAGSGIAVLARFALRIAGASRADVVGAGGGRGDAFGVAQTGDALMVLGVADGSWGGAATVGSTSGKTGSL